MVTDQITGIAGSSEHELLFPWRIGWTTGQRRCLHRSLQQRNRITGLATREAFGGVAFACTNRAYGAHRFWRRGVEIISQRRR